MFFTLHLWRPAVFEKCGFNPARGNEEQERHERKNEHKWSYQMSVDETGDVYETHGSKFVLRNKSQNPLQCCCSEKMPFYYPRVFCSLKYNKSVLLFNIILLTLI